MAGEVHVLACLAAVVRIRSHCVTFGVVENFEAGVEERQFSIGVAGGEGGGGSSEEEDEADSTGCRWQRLRPDKIPL